MSRFDPRNNRVVRFLMLCTGGLDAWTDPLPEPDKARSERVCAWVTVAGAMMVVLAFVGAGLMEALQWL